MKLFLRALFFCASFLLSLSAVSPALAQTPPSSIDASQLPPHTLFYVLWRGAPSPSARSANSLYALWDDPDFAPARNALFDSFLSESRKSADAKSQLTREELSEYTPLLDNPLAVGFVSDPSQASSNSVSLKTDASAHKWNGIFFIYDRSGKEALLAKAVLRMRAADKEPATLSPITIAGIPAMKLTGKGGTNYWVESGKYVVSSGELSVVEQILRGLKIGPNSASLLSSTDTAALQQAARSVKGAAPAFTASGLGGVPAFKEASAVLGEGALEFFLNISDIAKLAKDVPTPAGFRAGTVLDALNVKAMHSIAGRVYLDGTKTRFQTVVLGDTSEGTIFDIWGAGQTRPASIAYIPQDAVSYREFQVNLPGIYALAMHVAKSFLTQGDQDKTDMIESMARAKLGMSTSDALHSLTGEMGYLQSDSFSGLGKSTFFLGVNNRDNALRLIRHAFLDNIISDTDLDGVTFVTLSSGNARTSSTPGNSPAVQYHLAVTDDLILVSANKAAFRSPLAKRKSSATPSQLAPFFAAHSGAPAAVNGLSFLDFQKFDWQSLKNLPGRNKAIGTSVLLEFVPDKTVPPQRKSWLDEIDPKVFSRHLHLSYGYSWKDANGLHLEGWID
ncbi:MAG: hypothetical protein JSS69_07020 [Acidobacteria bacterium]|nr:hypothetical protein [Acidobacteriota bacterium]MBS1865655.1 hypothetical protein [Acidobacteriota bacterium]